MWIKWWPVQNEELGEFDVAGALAEISDGLGLEEGGGDDSSTGDTGGGGTGDSSAAPVTGGDAAPGEGKEGEAGTPAAPAKGVEGVPAPVKQEVTPDVLPKTWKPEMAEEWSKASPALRAEVARREEEMFRGIEGYKTDAGFGRTVQKVIEPYVPILQQHGINPIQQIGDLMNAHKTLALGTPEAKVGMLKWLAQEYSIDLTGMGVAPANGQGQQAPYVDPAVQALQKQTQELQSRLEQSETARQQEVREKATAEVTAFKADPKNIYFDDVAGQVAQLIRSGVCATLQQAYEQAIYLNPVTREKEFARQTAERDKLQKEADAEKVAAAKKASAANTRTTAKNGGAAATVGSIDDTLNEAYDRMTTKG